MSTRSRSRTTSRPGAGLVQDRLPVSRNEKIEVKLLSPSERDIKREDDGKLVWNWELEPGKSRETVLKFSIDYPGNIEVSGL